MAKNVVFKSDHKDELVEYPSFLPGKLFSVNEKQSREAIAPNRPAMGILVLFSFGFWGMCALSYSTCISLEIEKIRTRLIIAATVCMLTLGAFAIFYFVMRKFSECSNRHVIAFVVAVSLIIGYMLGLWGAYSIFYSANSVTGQSSSWTITTLTDCEESSYYATCNAKATNSEGSTVRVSLSLPKDNMYLRGTRLSGTGTLSLLSDSNLQYQWGSGICSKLTLSNVVEVEQTGPFALVYSARKRAIEAFGAYGSEQAGSLQALACGYKNTIKDSGLYESYKVTGLAHLVSVSGAHLAVVVVMIGYLGALFNIHRNVLFAGKTILILAYLVFAGIPISALRASFMVLLCLSGSIAGRKSASLNSLGLCVIVFLLIDPSTSISVSFFLSAGSTFGIVMFASLMNYWMYARSEKVNAFVVQPLSLTFSSNIVTQPYSMAMFSQLSVIAPLANIICTPLFTLACVASLASGVLACFIQPAAFLFVFLGRLCVMPLEFAVKALAKVPYACIPVDCSVNVMLALSIVLCILLWVFWPKFKLRTVAAFGGVVCAVLVFVVVISPRLYTGTQLIMLDVAQGDSFLLRSGQHAVLVDTGQRDSKLKTAIAEAGVYSLDAVIISHHDADHMGSLESLSGYVNIGSVYSAAQCITCTCSNCATLRGYAQTVCPGTGLSGLSVGDVIQFGNFTITVVWPISFSDEGGNADSVCLLVETDIDGDGNTEWKTLMMGDAESDQLSQISNNALVGDIDVLKVGHHGSKVSMNSNCLDILKPEIALISVGENNRYGHPKQEALDFLEEANSTVFRTDLNGCVTLTYTSSSIEVSCDKMAS